MVNFRKFRNTDPPRLVQVWNDIFTARGAVPLQGTALFDRFILAKPYFDPAGLILAEENEVCLGFVHAGLAQGCEPKRGVTCMLGVRPGNRRRGIGTELLARSESYLRERGAQVLCAGEQGARSPFYLGLYGGSDSAGFLHSDAGAEPFFIKHGYAVERRIMVVQRDLSKPVRTADPRFGELRQRYELGARSPRHLDGFAQESTLGQAEPLEFFLLDKRTRQVTARTYAWEMEGFSCRWKRPAAGLVGFQVAPELRRQGLGKFLLVTLLKQLQEQYCEIIETHIDEPNSPALTFVRDLGFQQVDVGQVFMKAT